MTESFIKILRSGKSEMDQGVFKKVMKCQGPFQLGISTVFAVLMSSLLGT